ncbi:MAG TPA: hypothetical protein EYP14_06820 [Planctomycetaceae bacterium]|nr:hypothetical protein [Planctomycetaceae bacterium]
MNELEARRQRSMLELQQAAVELAVHIAEVVTHTDISRGEYAVEELVRKATEKLGLDGPVRIYLNPDDLALLNRRLNSQPDWLSERVRIELISSGEVKRGDCVAESGEALVVAELDLRLEEIRRDLLDGLEHAQVERRRAASSDRAFGRFPDRRQTA